MLRWIKIKGYKSLQDVEVELQPLVVLLGPNAAGKSNFLDALQLLSRMVACRILKEAFDPPYRGKPLESFTFAGQGIPELLRREGGRPGEQRTTGRGTPRSRPPRTHALTHAHSSPSELLLEIPLP